MTDSGADPVEPAGQVDGQDVAAIQDDDTLTPADRVDLIANQVILPGEGTDGAGEPTEKG